MKYIFMLKYIKIVLFKSKKSVGYLVTELCLYLTSSCESGTFKHFMSIFVMYLNFNQ